jgi:tetratricopeptide (TPR) repeat protein
MTESSLSERTAVVTHAGKLIEAAQYEDAAALLAQAVATDPGVGEYHYLLGTVAYRTGNTQTAMNEFTAAVTHDPQHAYAHYGLAVIYRDTGYIDRAIQQFQWALEADPALFAAQQQLLDLQATGQPSAAPTRYQAQTLTASTTPSRDEPAYTLAEVLDVRGRLCPDEETLAGPVVWKGRPALRSITGILLTALALILAPAFIKDTATGMPSGAIRELFAALWRLADAVAWPAALVLVAIGAARVATRRYVLRENRLEVFAGLVNRQHATVWLHDVERPVLVDQSLWQLALGLGNVEIDSTVLPIPKGRRQLGKPGKLYLAGLPITVAEQAAGFLRSAILWQRRRMVQNFVSAR